MWKTVCASPPGQIVVNVPKVLWTSAGDGHRHTGATATGTQGDSPSALAHRPTLEAGKEGKVSSGASGMSAGQGPHRPARTCLLLLHRPKGTCSAAAGTAAGQAPADVLCACSHVHVHTPPSPQGDA